MSDLINIKNDGEEMEVGLADIAGIDMNEVAEFDGFEATPKGLYDWEVKDAGLDTIETKNGNSGIIYFDLEVTNCHTLIGDDRDPATMIGTKHRETVFIGDVAKSVGQAKSIMQHAGFSAKGKLDELLDAFCGHAFTAPIKQRKDKNDSDKVYANLVIKKITPLGGAVAAA